MHVDMHVYTATSHMASFWELPEQEHSRQSRLRCHQSCQGQVPVGWQSGAAAVAAHEAALAGCSVVGSRL